MRAESKEPQWWYYVGWIVALAMGCFAGRWDGMAEGRKEEQKAAIQAGVAEYIADQTTGKVSFHYKNQNP